MELLCSGAKQYEGAIVVDLYNGSQDREAE